MIIWNLLLIILKILYKYIFYVNVKSLKFYELIFWIQKGWVSDTKKLMLRLDLKIGINKWIE